MNHPLFDTLRQVEIGDILHFVNRQCQFMEAFEHILGRYVKQEADERVITACLIAWGTNMGIGRMARISDIGYQVLSTTSDNFIRIETLRGANDLISNAIAVRPAKRQSSGEAVVQSYLSFSIMISVTPYIPVVTDRSLKLASIPSMPAIHQNISG